MFNNSIHVCLSVSDFNLLKGCNMSYQVDACTSMINYA